MNIHRMVSETDVEQDITQLETPTMGSDSAALPLGGRSQALWVLIAVSIVVGVNGILSWL